ncbi:hypothetical protein ACQEVB_40850 [Pseudonocardia sp. CA-107938]|uniref:hypothetical protein n=1 Tax=Pseudonocardia sp. CA-107938 TaxID=3240021 RepID=UPI003D8C0F72
MRTITDAQFRVAVAAAVAERGDDFIYPRGTCGWCVPDDGTHSISEAVDVPGAACLYVRTDVDEPACLFGLALTTCGVRPDELRPYEAWAVNDVLPLFIADVSEATQCAAGEAQREQDEGQTWGAALETFRRVAAELDD